VHRAFGLDTPIEGAPVPFSPRRVSRPPIPEATIDDGWCPAVAPRPKSALASGLEDLVISGVELDDRQGRVTVLEVPDRPGYAARIFRRVAEENGFVDMIVQNISLVGTPNLSFTVPRKDVERAAAAAASVVGADRVAVEPSIAKLSLLGVGMRSHTGVAAHMFGALAAQGIAISMINTSEVRINVVTDVRRGHDGLECLRRAFLQPNPLQDGGNGMSQGSSKLAAPPLVAANRTGLACER
jgi:aspartate kinase